MPATCTQLLPAPARTEEGRPCQQWEPRTTMIRQGRHRRGRAHGNGLRVRVGRRGAAGTHEMSILVNDQRAQHSSMHKNEHFVSWARDCSFAIRLRKMLRIIPHAGHSQDGHRAESRGLERVRSSRGRPGEMKSGNKSSKIDFHFCHRIEVGPARAGDHMPTSPRQQPHHLKRTDRTMRRNAAGLVHGLQTLGLPFMHT